MAQQAVVSGNVALDPGAFSSATIHTSDTERAQARGAVPHQTATAVTVQQALQIGRLLEAVDRDAKDVQPWAESRSPVLNQAVKNALDLVKQVERESGGKDFEAAKAQTQLAVAAALMKECREAMRLQQPAAAPAMPASGRTSSVAPLEAMTTRADGVLRGDFTIGDPMQRMLVERPEEVGPWARRLITGMMKEAGAAGGQGTALSYSARSMLLTVQMKCTARGAEDARQYAEKAYTKLQKTEGTAAASAFADEACKVLEKSGQAEAFRTNINK